MRESIFQGEWRDSWRYHFPKCHFHKEADAPKSDKTRFLPPKQYDCRALLEGTYYAMELKLKTKIQAFPFKEVTEWQIDNLKEARDAGGNAFVVINYRVSRIPERTRKKHGLNSDVNLAFCIDVDRFIYLDKSINAKSIPFLDLVNNSIVVERDGDFWDIPKMIFS